VTGEIIEVCQDCGHLIDNPPVVGPDGRRYLFRLCLRHECLVERMMAESAAALRRDIERNSAQRIRALYLTPIVADPNAAFRIVGPIV
jgi:hypothetical protein